MQAKNGLAQSICSIKNQMIPNEGPKTVPCELDFDTTDTLIINGLTLQQLGQLSIIQTIYVDTSSGAPLQILCGSSRQLINIPANKQGYVNVLLPGTFELTFVAAMGSFARVQLINVPIAGILWDTV